MILPSMLMAPAYFRGEVELGAISQVFSAFNSVKQVLMFVANNFGTLANLQAKAQRLEDLHDSLRRAAADFQIAKDQKIKLEELSMDGERSLLHVQGLCVAVQTGSAILPRVRWLGTVGGNLCGSTFDVRPGMALLLKGASGVGKSALLRAVAGLWTQGVGHIRRTSNVFFLPQTPYLPTGIEDATSTLREQLLFPMIDESTESRKVPSAEDLCKVLDAVGLSSLLVHSVGLDARADWALSLSGGERQRLAFARLVLQLSMAGGEGCLVLLDEATSACDEDTEAVLYGILLKQLYTGATPGALVSVGHRSSLLAFHTESLELAPLRSSDGV
eukprot:gnl/MRDRNA2_/MRDRNA2_77542_c0_seq1.p1 gnl/MRDRNA2_/MRDRNA2_77542_c0~~gnl/MRDRNA2_/MRDRNA2_77542_c0_seq1.p1  ORF type:complete len:331 (-),score=46.34 gnl/MRDRNA2_/MRDRNA2_77542_c0_seq1:216-1208(-)